VLIKLWNFFCGYVKIELSGFSVERFVNRALAEGLAFWDFSRVGGKFLGYLSLGDYRASLALAERTGSVIKVLGFYGLPAWINRFKKRLFLVVGGFAFLAGLIVLTSFIWRIDIVGASRVSETEILEFLDENGFSLGRFRYGIAYRDIEALLLLEFEDLAWASLSVTGTRALINVQETIELTQEPLKEGFADIVAAKDGIIVYMATASGFPLYVPGDVVAAGEVVVAGRIEAGSPEEGNLTYSYVRAESEIWARVYYRMDFDIPLTYFEKSFTGEVRRGYTIEIGKREWKLPFELGSNDDFIYYETVYDRKGLALGKNYPLPVAWVRTSDYELVRILCGRSVEEARFIGEELALRRIAEEIGEDAEIVDKQIIFADGEKSVAVSVLLIVIERIDKVRELDEYLWRIDTCP
jgi:similar to stage IV sporulation protein